MKVWKKSIVSLAVAFALLASFIPAPMNIAAAVEAGDTITYDFAKGTKDGISGTSDARVYSESADLDNGYGAWSTNNEHHTSITAAYTDTTNTRISFQGEKYGIFIQSSGIGQWLTFRITVPEAGWYKTNVNVWMNYTYIKSTSTETKRGCYFRSYIAPVSFSAGSITDATKLANALAALREDKYSIGRMTCYDPVPATQDKTSQSSDRQNYITFDSQEMRPVKLSAGEYAFTVMVEEKDAAMQILIKSLELTKIADANADEATVKNAIGDLNLDLNSLLPAASRALTAGQINTMNTSASNSIGDDANNIFRSADVVFFESDAVSATVADDKESVSVIGDTASSNTTLKAVVKRDGLTWEKEISGITVTGNDAVDHTITASFKEQVGDTGSGYDIVAKEYKCVASNWYLDAEYDGFSRCVQYTSAGLDISGGTYGNWITFRVIVDRPGYYTPTLMTWERNSGGIIRAFISEVVDSADVSAKEAVYCADANSIGTIDTYDAATSGVVPHSEKMRTVYFDKAGEYAFTLRRIGKNDLATSAAGVRPTYLELKREALRTAQASNTVPAMTNVISENTATVAANENVEIALAPVMSNNAVEDLVSAKNITASANNSNVTVDITDVKNSYNCITGKALKLTGVSAGISTVTLTVTDAYGVVTTDTVEVTVTAPVVKCFGNMYAYLVGNENDGYKLWMFGGIDSDNYAEIGFEVAGTKKGGPTVYKQINIEYNNKANKAEITAETFNLTDGYVFYHTEDLGDSIADDEISVRAYAKDANGEYIYGEAVVIDPDADDSAASN